MKRIIYILLAAAVTSTALTACFPLAVGAVGGGALAVSYTHLTLPTICSV